MGNPLSCFIANILMADLEWNIRKLDCFPRVWKRYVDDIFVVIDKDKVNSLHEEISSKYESINFTIEYEKDNKIPFLDLLLTRRLNKVEISVYRKTTNTDRYITINSNCSFQQKMASFNSMVFRLCSLPLNIKNYMDEIQTIKRIASKNGFQTKKIDELVKKHSRNIKLKELTTLKKQKEPNETLKRCKFTYVGDSSLALANILKKYDINCVFKTDDKIKDLLGNPKDKIDPKQKSGIYSISCLDCPRIYIGQTRRSIGKRYAEHRNHFRNMDQEKSAVAKHMWENNHQFNESCLKLEKVVHDRFYLDAVESLIIHRNRDVMMNLDLGPNPSRLFSIRRRF